MTRPTVGTTITLPSTATRYRVTTGVPAPLGYLNRDGVLWTEERSGSVVSVRKVRKGWKCSTSLGFAVVINDENAGLLS